MIPSENIITNIIEYLYRSSKSVVRIITRILKQGLKINHVFKGDNFRQISKLQRNVVSLERKTFEISRLFFFGNKKKDVLWASFRSNLQYTCAEGGKCKSKIAKMHIIQ